MSGPALKIVPQVNLDEFERRLRAAGAPADAHEDPLEELARLVGLDVGAAKSGRESTGAPTPQAPPVRLPHIDESLHDAGGFDRLLRVSFSDEKTEDGGVLSSASADEEPAVLAVQEDYPPREAAPSAAVQDEAADAIAEPTPAAPRRSGRTKFAMGVLISLGAAGFVAAWAVKGAPGLPKAPPVILAVEGPTKVQPPSQDTIASPSDSASVLLKDPTSKPGPVKLVSNEEQPVDLQQQAPPPGAAANQTPGEQTPDRPLAALATVAATTAAPTAPAPFPEPKRVKTVSVRPDGSLILAAAQSVDAGPSTAPPDAASSSALADMSPPAPGIAPPSAEHGVGSSAPSASAPRAVNIAEPAAAKAPETTSEARAADTSEDLPLPRPSDVPVPKARPSFNSSVSGAAPQSATPKLELPARPSSKSTARVPIAKIDTTVVGATSQAPESPLQIVPELLGSVAKAVTGQSAAQPTTQVAAAEPVASPSVASAPAKSLGSYDVQLAAPGSKEEAQSASMRLRTKYAAELTGLEPVIHQAEVNGRSIYRVRISGLSKADAVALCVKLKAAGGDAACFVARN